MHRFKKLFFPLCVAAFALTLLAISLKPADLLAQTTAVNPISPELATLIAQNQDRPIRFIVTMHDQIALDLDRLPQAEVPRRALIVRSLQTVAAESQSGIVPELKALQKRSVIRTFRPLWIVNAIAAEGTADAVLTLAKRPDVAKIDLDHEIEPVRPVAELTLNASGASSETWGIERINAPHVWHGFGITGTGVTVAIMDSGTDFEHPALINNYRGRQADGTFVHAGNWFQPAVPTQTSPIDLFGHGTHVAGTAIGRLGIGVAPGAEWIAVSIADTNGQLLESYIHAGFEWLLAPDGNPALAPDLVNGSWGGPGIADLFVEDFERLKAANIIPVFATGNSGPFTTTIGSPSSYTNTISVGATTIDNQIAWFSSRWPSPQHAGIAPLIAAPGARIYSSLPSNEYGFFSGTSMATPHTTGALALLLSADRSLKNNGTLLSILAKSAVPFEEIHPNSNSGYGMLDAAELVEDYVVQTGRLSGIVQSGGVPLAGVQLTITAESGSFQIETDSDGQYSARMLPGNYAISVDHAGYDRYASGSVHVHLGATLINIPLKRQPFGVLSGEITNLAGERLTSTVQIDGVNGDRISVQSKADGTFTAELPLGSHQVTVIKSGYKIGQSAVRVTAGQTVSKDFSLTESDSILLVDAGAWSFRSRETFYADALIEAGEGWDTFKIIDPVFGHPPLETLDDYDVVIWSDPRYSPGYIGATVLISDYVGTGGNLLISGNQIAIYDYQNLFEFDWIQQLAFAEPTSIVTFTEPIIGRPATEFASLDFIVPTPGKLVTTLESRIPAKSELIVSHGTPHAAENGAGIKAGHCEDYNLVYFGFEIADIESAEDRGEVLQRSFEWFNHPKQASGVEWLSKDQDSPVVPGESYRYDLRFYNRSETITSTFQISADAAWQTDILTESVAAGPCGVADSVVTITVPADLVAGDTHQTILTVADSQNSAVNSVLTISHKAPATLLLVEDYRWYSQLERYKPVLDQFNLDYDVWATDGDAGRGGPPATLLQEYDYVVWYTAYDWFEPITQSELESLEAYLDSGGRLFFTSQDFMYHHAESDLARNYFGIIDFAESITPTLAYGDALFGVPAAITGSVPITFNQFPNNGDSLFPTQDGGATPLLFHDRGIGGVGNADEHTGGRSVFWSVPFMGLDDQARTDVMANTLGWLGDLGESSIKVDVPVVDPGSSQTFTIVVRNRPDGVAQTAMITNALPAGLGYVTGSLSGGATWHSDSRTVRWQGELAPGEAMTFTYSTLAQSADVRQNGVTIQSSRDPIVFNRAVTVQAGGANLSGSTVNANVGPMTVTPIGAGLIFKRSRLVTYTVVLENSGNLPAENITATTFIPAEMNVVTDTISAVAGSAFFTGTNLIWTGDAPPKTPITVTAVFTTRAIYLDDWLVSTITIEDESAPKWFIHQPRFIEAVKMWLPIAGK